MSSRRDGGQSRATVPALTNLSTVVQGTLLVRMIKPNLICSHNWHVQPSFQRSVRALRLSGALLDRGLDCVAQVVLELVRLPSRFSARPAFLSELFKPIELLALCQTSFSASVLSCRNPSQHPVGGHSRTNPTRTGQLAIHFESALSLIVSELVRLQRKSFKQRPAPLEPLEAHEESYPRVLQWGCSLKDSLQGLRG